MAAKTEIGVWMLVVSLLSIFCVHKVGLRLSNDSSQYLSMTAYALHRPTISIAPRQFSSRIWDENQVRETMSTYHAKYLITYSGLFSDDAPEQQQSPFLRSLIAGEHHSSLSPVVRTPHVTIFEARDR